MIPKPRSKYSYCSVCKADYDDYIEVSFFWFSIFRPASTRPSSKTTNLKPSLTKCAKNSCRRMKKPWSNNLKNTLKKLVITSCFFHLRNQQTLTSTLQLNQCKASLVEVNSGRSMAGCNLVRLSSSYLMATTKICWDFMTIPSEFQLIPHCHQ